MGLSKKIISNPIKKEVIAGTKMGSSFERPANRMVLISLFFFNLTKKRIPENKIIKIDI